MESDSQYYTRRAAEELQAAARATCLEAQSRHRALAEQYSEIVQQAEGKTATES